MSTLTETTLTARLAGTAIGAELFRSTEHLDRDKLVRYAGASGDFNPIHYNDVAAVAAGLPGVIAHGVLTMALASTAVEKWTGDPRAVRRFSVRFSAMVPVPNPGGVDLQVVGTLAGRTDDVATIDLEVTLAGTGVLSNASVDVNL